MLELKNVSKTFNPGTVNEKKALSGLSLHLSPGDFVTIIGSNGAGKSTLFNAIAGGFYVDEGAVMVDGEDITFLPEYQRARMIGRIFQDPMKGTAPSMTVEENMALSYLRSKQRHFGFGISKKERSFFQEQLARLDLGLEDRLDSPIGLLSGGQRQRISIARAILKNPPILILDEATSALDTESERLVQEALERLMKTRTTIAIAHRLSTIKNADEICVLYEGEIVERGKHEELLAKNGYYKKLNDMQSLG